MCTVTDEFFKNIPEHMMRAVPVHFFIKMLQKLLDCIPASQTFLAQQIQALIKSVERADIGSWELRGVNKRSKQKLSSFNSTSQLQILAQHKMHSIHLMALPIIELFRRTSENIYGGHFEFLFTAHVLSVCGILNFHKNSYQFFSFHSSPTPTPTPLLDKHSTFFNKL